MPSTVPIDFRTLFRALPSPYVLLDREFTIVDMNEAYLAATMRTRESIVGRNMFDAFPSEGESRSRLQESLERARDEGVSDVLALIPYSIARPADQGGGVDLRTWSATHIPLRGKDGDVAYILQHTQDVTELQRLREAARVDSASVLGTDVLRRAEAVHQVNRTLRAERAHLRRLFTEAPGFMCVLVGDDLVFELANKAFRQVIGGREVVGLPAREALPDLKGQGFFELLEKVHQTGKVYVGQGMELVIQPTEGARPERRYVDFVYQPILEPDGTVSAIFVEGSDITGRIRAEEQQRLLMDELNHRVKNTLATVQAIAVQTLRATPPGAFADTFLARLSALASTHDVLTKGQWAGADLGDLVRRTLAPHGLDRVTLEGAPIMLPPQAALSLGLVFHELATNASKYGALSSAGGHLRVAWAAEPLHGEPGLVVDWRETGGPPAEPPTRRGFGSRLIERSVTVDLAGTFVADYRPEGFHCRLTGSLAAANMPRTG